MSRWSPLRCIVEIQQLSTESPPLELVVLCFARGHEGAARHSQGARLRVPGLMWAHNTRGVTRGFLLSPHTWQLYCNRLNIRGFLRGRN